MAEPSKPFSPSHVTDWFVPSKQEPASASDSSAFASELTGYFIDTSRTGQLAGAPAVSTAIPFVTTDDPSTTTDLLRLLSATLAPLGYAYIGREGEGRRNEFAFRAAWSSAEVEHYLAFTGLGFPVTGISADLSLRNVAASAFGAGQVLKCLPDSYREIFARTPVWSGPVITELGQNAGWAPSKVLETETLGCDEIAERIRAMVKSYVIPTLGHIRTIADLFDAALPDDSLLAWRSWGDSARVAMLAFIGRQLGRDPEGLRAALTPHAGPFTSPPMVAAFTPEQFVDAAIRDADSQLALIASRPR